LPGSSATSRRSSSIGPVQETTRSRVDRPSRTSPDGRDAVVRAVRPKKDSAAGESEPLRGDLVGCVDSQSSDTCISWTTHDSQNCRRPLLPVSPAASSLARTQPLNAT
jgi:hypothetical protein